MNKRSYLIVLLFIVLCSGWIALARIRESLAPVPGWIQFGNTGEEHPNFEFWLPDYYEGMDSTIVTWMMKDAADHYGSQYSSLLDEVKIVFSARDTRSHDAVPDVLVGYSFAASGPETAELAQEELRSQFKKQFNFKVIDSDARSLNNRTIIFVAYDWRVQGLDVRQVQYIIYDGDITWRVLFVTNRDKYREELAVFEKSIQTFKVRE